MAEEAADQLASLSVDGEEKAAPTSLRTSGDLTKEETLAFFAACGETQGSDAFKARMSAHMASGGKPNTLMVDMQTEVMESMGIDKTFGTSCLAKINTCDDDELKEGLKAFTRECQWGFVRALRDNPVRPLRRAGDAKMTRPEVMQFLDACIVMAGMPETMETLRKAFADGGEKAPPNADVIQQQHDMLETLGFEHTFGVACLNSLGDDFPNDYDIMQKMQKFAESAQESCQRSMMSDEEFAEKKREMAQIQRIQRQGQNEVAAMDAAALQSYVENDCSELRETMQKKFQEFSGDQEALQRYVMTLDDAEQLKLVKMQMASMRLMQMRGGGGDSNGGCGDQSCKHS